MGLRGSKLYRYVFVMSDILNKVDMQIQIVRATRAGCFILTASSWWYPPSGHITFMQRRINVRATLWRCIDNATLYRRHTPVGQFFLLLTSPVNMIWDTLWQNQHCGMCAQRRLRSAWVSDLKKAWVLSYPLSAKKRLWSDWANAQADLSFRWPHKPFCWFCHEMAQLFLIKGTDTISGEAETIVFAPFSGLKAVYSKTKAFFLGVNYFLLEQINFKEELDAQALKANSNSQKLRLL